MLVVHIFTLSTKENVELGRMPQVMLRITPIKYYDKALAIQPNYVGALTDKGEVLQKLGNFTGATKYYDKALAIQPNYVGALKQRLLQRLGNSQVQSIMIKP